MKFFVYNFYSVCRSTNISCFFVAPFRFDIFGFDCIRFKTASLPSSVVPAQRPHQSRRAGAALRLPAGTQLLRSLVTEVRATYIHHGRNGGSFENTKVSACSAEARHCPVVSSGQPLPATPPPVYGSRIDGSAACSRRPPPLPSRFGATRDSAKG